MYYTHNRQAIRKTMYKKRAQLPVEIQIASSQAVCKYIAKTHWFKHSHRIAFYQPLPGEFNLSSLIQHAWALKKYCYLPVCTSSPHHSLLFYPYFQNDPLHLNRYGILEPEIFLYPSIQPFTLDLVFVPLLAFDYIGNRLGYGKGYYDRTFAYLRHIKYPTKPLFVGIGYAFQEVVFLRAQAWDIQLHTIITILH